MNEPVVLFALTPGVREGFLPGWDAAKTLPFRTEWADASGMSPESLTRLLREKCPRVVVTGWGTPVLPDPEFLGELPGYVCHLAGSVRGHVPRSWLERGVLVSNWGSSISHTIAEHAVLLILGSLRNMALWNGCMKGQADGTRAKSALKTRSLKGRRVGIHGFGAIARELVSLLRPFGVVLSAYSEGVPEELFRRCEVRRCGDLAELFAGSDILVELESLTERSRGVVNRELLEKLPPGAVFVNVGRGAVVDEGSLAEMAVAGRIRVALDVYETEPLPMDSPLRDCEAVLMSPHIAGPTEDSFASCGDFALKNLRSYFEGGSVEGRVTLEIYDRST